jgi:hypothetical protein
MNSRDWEDFRRTVLGDKDVSVQTGITVNALLGLGGASITQGLEQLLGDPMTVLSKPLSTLDSTRTLPILTETINALTGTRVSNGQWHNSLLPNAFGLAPLVRGLLSLVGRDDPSEIPEPIRFSRPAPLLTEAAMSSGNRFVNIDRGIGDRIRPLRGPDGSASFDNVGSAGSPAMSTAVNNITVQVNAIDSRSFLDHSDDIARAVRDAMLHSHALNDVVNDL